MTRRRQNGRSTGTASSGKKRKAEPSKAQDVIDWIQAHCRIPECRDVGKLVVLRHWQQAELRKIYDNPAGTQRAIISVGTKNAKTTLGGLLLLPHLVRPRSMTTLQ